MGSAGGGDNLLKGSGALLDLADLEAGLTTVARA